MQKISSLWDVSHVLEERRVVRFLSLKRVSEMPRLRAYGCAYHRFTISNRIPGSAQTGYNTVCKNAGLPPGFGESAESSRER
jgi:hypothetical protein